jgi:lysophospholipase
MRRKFGSMARMNYEIGTFPCKTGFMRWARMAGPAAPRGCVLVNIGWGEWIEKYMTLAQEFYERGFETVVLERQGQGLSSRYFENRMLGWLPDFQNQIDDFDAFYNSQFAGDGVPLLLMGHSMGAHILLRWYLEKNPTENIRGLILSSFMQRIKTAPFTYGQAEMIASMANFFGLGRSYAPGQATYDPVNVPFEQNVITGDEARYRAMVVTLRDNPLLKCGGISFGWLNATFRSARQLEARLKLGAPPGPYLMLSPQNDPLVETTAMKDVAAYLPNCESRFFGEARHELLEEKEAIRAQVWSAMDAFIASRVRGV